jgi:hypothetical protein
MVYLEKVRKAHFLLLLILVGSVLINEFSFDRTTTDLMPHIAGHLDTYKVRLIISEIISLPIFLGPFHSRFIGKLEDITSSSNMLILSFASYFICNQSMFPKSCPILAFSCAVHQGRDDACWQYLLPAWCPNEAFGSPFQPAQALFGFSYMAVPSTSAPRSCNLTSVTRIAPCISPRVSGMELWYLALVRPHLSNSM